MNLKLSANNQRYSNVKCQLDRGSTCNTIGYAQFRRLARSSSPKLHPSDVKLRVYNGSIIKPVGKAQINCAYNGKSYNLTFQVLNNNVTPLLSAETCTCLGLLSVQINLVNSSNVNGMCYTVDDDLITECKDTFRGLSCLPGKYHIEDYGNVTPVQHVSRIPIFFLNGLKAHLKALEASNVITPVKEPTKLISSMVAVCKPGKLRPCIDPKDLYKAIKRPHYPLPTIENVLVKLTKAKIFSALDAKKGFWQIELDNTSSFFKTFWTPFGRYRWLRMPFGISSAPEEFQRRQNELLGDLEGVDVIADDVLVYRCGDSDEEALRDHEKNLKALLQRACVVNLKLTKISYN